MLRRRGSSGTRRGRRAAVGRFARAALLLLRAVAVCLSLQMSGFLHFATDLWLDGEAAARHFSESEGDGDDDCPPGCPTCHCVHASPVLPIPFEAPASKLLPAFEVTWAPYEARSPASPAPPSVYRPPRAPRA